MQTPRARDVCSTAAPRVYVAFRKATPGRPKGRRRLASATVRMRVQWRRAGPAARIFAPTPDGHRRRISVTRREAGATGFDYGAGFCSTGGTHRPGGAFPIWSNARGSRPPPCAHCQQRDGKANAMTLRKTIGQRKATSPRSLAASSGTVDVFVADGSALL